MILCFNQNIFCPIALDSLYRPSSQRSYGVGIGVQALVTDVLFVLQYYRLLRERFGSIGCLSCVTVCQGLVIILCCCMVDGMIEKINPAYNSLYTQNYVSCVGNSVLVPFVVV